MWTHPFRFLTSDRHCGSLTLVVLLALAGFSLLILGASFWAGRVKHVSDQLPLTAVALVAGVNYFGLELNAKLLIGLLFVQLALLAVFVAFVRVL